MGWTVTVWGTVIGLLVIRLMLRQLRELLLDLGAVVRAWRDLLRVMRGPGPPTEGSGG